MVIFAIYSNSTLVKSFVRFYAFIFKYNYKAKGKSYKQLIFLLVWLKKCGTSQGSWRTTCREVQRHKILANPHLQIRGLHLKKDKAVRIRKDIPSKKREN